MAKPILFIAGIPGSGKTEFGFWLSTNKGFTHIDMEYTGLDQHHFRDYWEEFRNPNANSMRFVDALVAHKKPVVLDWGFPVHCLPLVIKLKNAGIILWWFDGDRLATRSYFKNRRTIDVARFDSQYANISAVWPDIEPAFGENIIKTVETDGTHLSMEEIYRQIFGI